MLKIKKPSQILVLRRLLYLLLKFKNSDKMKTGFIILSNKRKHTHCTIMMFKMWMCMPEMYRKRN